jgi:imidazolonepropionase-like amidohydrolase
MKSLIIEGGNILDLRAGELLMDHHVLVRDGMIVKISPTELRDEVDCRIDAKGKTVMPGFIDCHVHVIASEPTLTENVKLPNILTGIRAVPILQGMVARGFTTVRDAGGADWSLMQAVEQGLIPGRRIFPSGKALSQTGGHGDFRPRSDTLPSCACGFRAGAIARIADGVDAVRLAVREEIQMGATQIKVMASGGVASPNDPIANTQYSEDELRAIVLEAEAANTYVMAHAYTSRAIERAVRCGVRTIEHGNLIDRKTADLMAEKGAFLVPTLVTYEVVTSFAKSLGYSQDQVERAKLVQASGLESLRILADAGVRMGFGSDLQGTHHDKQSHEFKLRADVLGNLETLRQATIVAAEIVNMTGKLGTISAGAIADILVIDGNPLEDISTVSQNGERIEFVVQRGQVVKSRATAEIQSVLIDE